MPPKGKGKDAKAKPGKKGGPVAGIDPKNMQPPKPKKIPPPPACFKPYEIADFKLLFKSFDEENIDKVPLKSIPLMLRKAGFNPKGAEVEEMFKRFLEDDLVDTVEFHEFLQMLEAKLSWGDDVEAEVTKAMGFLAHDAGGEENPTGFINIETLKEELENWGEPLTEIEFVDLPKVALKEKLLVFETGILNYPKFVERMNEKDVKFVKEPVNFWKLDQKTLAAMAMEKAMEEKAEMERREAERKAKEEAKRQRMIEQGLILPDA